MQVQFSLKYFNVDKELKSTFMYSEMVDTTAEHTPKAQSQESTLRELLKTLLELFPYIYLE